MWQHDFIIFCKQIDTRQVKGV